MNILFIHKTFPAQFEYLIQELLTDVNNTVTFITNNPNSPDIKGVLKYVCEPKQEASGGHPYLSAFEEAVILGQTTAKMALTLKNSGYNPDIIYGFSGWGSAMFIKDVFPKTPFLCYFEWLGKAENSVFDFGGKVLDEETRAEIRCNNAYIIQNLLSADAIITPTNWQKSLLPKEFQDKTKVIHDGIDTELCKPDSEVKIFLEDKKIELTAKDEIITYGTRGMEPYRGFPEFMRAVEKLLKKRPNAHFVIAGSDVNCYSPQLENCTENGTYKGIMLKELDIDMDRVHFVGTLPFEHYIKLLQISYAHVYLTYPYVLSWSILNAMATGCCVVASSTAPVLEVVKDNYNGLLVDFFDVDDLVRKIEYALDNKEKMTEIRNNARKTIVENYSQKELLPKQIDYIKSLISK